MKSFIRVMKALSEPSRVKIIKLLQAKPLCVCELQQMLGLSQPAVSKHLKTLETAGLVASEKDGLWVNYSLSYGSDNLYATSLLGHLRHWLDEDPQIARLVRIVPKLSRRLAS